MQHKFWRSAAVLAVVASFFVAVGSASAATIGTPWTESPYVSWTSDGHGGIAHAEIGYWTGGFGGEPWGRSRLAVPITVGNGGTLDFEWLIQSTDTPYYDPVYIFLNDESGNTVAWYAYASGATGWRHAHTDLAPYAGRQLTLYFDNYQDAYGDQTRTLLVNLTLGDSTAPTIVGTPADQVVEATGPAGATVTYTAPTATDDTDPSPAVSCAPGSATAFAIGESTVTCTATDATGNQATSSFTVTVRDTTAPALSLPNDLTVDAASPAGSGVTYVATASDLVDGATAVTCSPASGTVFAVGSTTVTCSSTDVHNNTATGSFTVTVRSAAQQLAALAASVAGVGPGASLGAKVAAAQASLASGNTAATINQLRAFLHEVAAQSGKKLTEAQAASLTATANAIIAALGG